MSSEQQLISQWRELPSEKQQEVVDFVDFLSQRSVKHETIAEQPSRQQFLQLREEVIASGTPLLSDLEVEQAVADRRGAYQEAAQ